MRNYKGNHDIQTQEHTDDIPRNKENSVPITFHNSDCHIAIDIPVIKQQQLKQSDEARNLIIIIVINIIFFSTLQ